MLHPGSLARSVWSGREPHVSGRGFPTGALMSVRREVLRRVASAISWGVKKGKKRKVSSRMTLDCVGGGSWSAGEGGGG